MQPDQSARPSRPDTFNILFVCTGNTCRSPMAEAVAREQLARRGWSHVCAASAGVAAEAGHAASPQAVVVIGRRGLDLSSHRSRALTPELVEWADLILAMGPSHLGAIAHQGGEHKMALLGEFAEGASGRAVADPFGGSEADYEVTLRDLELLVDRALDRLEPILHP